MKKDEVLKHFTSIYNHEYSELPNDSPNTEDDLVPDNYETDYVMLIFLGACGVPVHENLIEEATRIYGLFKVSMVLRDLVAQNKISFTYNDKDQDYEYSAKPSDLKKYSPEDLEIHHEHLHRQFDKMAEQFIALIKKAQEQAASEPPIIDVPTTKDVIATTNAV